MTKEKIRVIFRREYDKYAKKWGYLAIYPDDEANRGRLNCLPFKLCENYNIFESHDEVDILYLLKRKLVHKNTEEAKRCKEAVERYYASNGAGEFELVVCERVTRR